MTLEEEAAVTAAVAIEVAKHRAHLEQTAMMMDSLRAGSSDTPHQAAWMKSITFASELPAHVIEQPLGTLTAEDLVCSTTGRALRPSPLALFLPHLRRVHVDLEKNPLLKKVMLLHGTTCVKCPTCKGPTEYLGDSMSIERGKAQPTKGGGIRMVLYPNGLYSPSTFGVSACTSACCARLGKPFDHAEALPSLPPALQNLIPFDPESGMSSGTLLHRDVFRPAVMDMHLGEGPNPVAEKLTKMGGRLVTETINATLDLGQSWLNDLNLLVGDAVWGKLSAVQKLQFAPLRAELLLADEAVDKLGLVSPTGKEFTKDPAGLYALPVQAELIRSAVLNGYEARKEHRRAEAAAVGASLKLSFDFTKQPGLNVSSQWLLTCKNENGQTVGKAAGATSNYEDYEDFIREIGARPNVTAPLICLDDVMETEIGNYDARTLKLMEWIPTAEEVILDRFHVVHRVNEVFNNHHLDFYELMIVKQRDVVTHRDRELELRIDGLLRQGTLNKTVTFRGVQYSWGGTPMKQEEIEEHKCSGLYHAMLSSTNALVPVVPNPRKHVEDYYPLWQAEVSEAIRSCTTASPLYLVSRTSPLPQLLVPAGAHVHSWPDRSVAPPQIHTFEVALGSLPQSDGIASLQIIDGSRKQQLHLQLMINKDDTMSNPMLEITCSISCEAGDGRTGRLEVHVVHSNISADASCLVPLKATDVTRNGQLLCDYDEFRRRTTLGLARFKLCSLQKLAIKPYRETTLDANGEMQHESLISTASNENTHKRLAGFSGRGRGEDLATGAMIEGDYIDSRRAAMRHRVPGCGADVNHDELQLAGLANKLAGFDGSGGASSQLPSLLPGRAYDYNLPCAASPSFQLVKHLAGGNAFNHRKPERSIAAMEASKSGALALPVLSLRTSLARPLAGATVSMPQPPTCAAILIAAHGASTAVLAERTASRKRKAVEWMPGLGCDCGSHDAHKKHVRKCAKWLCTCKPPATGRGGDASHTEGCLRGAFARHTQEWRAPVKGDRALMRDAARRMGCADRIHDGREWVVDPQGRPLEHSVWIA